jgi:hypothetical protein
VCSVEEDSSSLLVKCSDVFRTFRRGCCLHCQGIGYHTVDRKPQLEIHVNFIYIAQVKTFYTRCSSIPVQQVPIRFTEMYIRWQWISKVVCRNKVSDKCLCSGRYYNFDVFLFGAWAPCGPGPPHSWGFYITHNDTPQSVGLFWTCDQPVTENSTWQNITITTDRHPCLRWNSNPKSQQASGRRPTPYRAATGIGTTSKLTDTKWAPVSNIGYFMTPHVHECC